MPLQCNAAAVAVFEIFGGVSETRQSKIGILADHVGPILEANGPCFLEHLEETAIRLFQTMPLPLEHYPRLYGNKIDLRQKHADPGGSTLHLAQRLGELALWHFG